MRSFKQMVAFFLIACVSLQAQASTLPDLSKSELEQRTRGSVLKQRLADRQIRVLCEDEVMTTTEECKDYGFYLVKKESRKRYTLELLGSDLGVLDWQGVQQRMAAAAHYFRPHHNMGDIVLLLLACIFPPLIIPVAIYALTHGMSQDIQNARIENLNERLAKFERLSMTTEGKDVHLNKKKFEMALTAFKNVLVSHP